MSFELIEGGEKRLREDDENTEKKSHKQNAESEAELCLSSDWQKLHIEDKVKKPDGVDITGPHFQDSWQYKKIRNILSGKPDQEGFKWQPFVCRDELYGYSKSLAESMVDNLVFLASARSYHEKGKPCVIVLSVMVVKYIPGNNSAYVELLCSGVNSVGSRLLAYALTKLKILYNNLEFVHLESLEDAFGFYNKQGFVGYEDDMKFKFSKHLPVHVAVENNDLVVLRALLRHLPETINAKNFKGETPLMIAATRNREEAVKALIENGADVDEALHVAVQKNNRSLVKMLLLASAKFNRKHDIAKLLYKAVRIGHVGIAEELLNVGVKAEALVQYFGEKIQYN